MAGTIAQPQLHAKYATISDEPVTLVKAPSGLYVLYEESRIERFTPQMALATVVLGDVTLADTQAMWDRASGGYAGVCTSRQMEVA